MNVKESKFKIKNLIEQKKIKLDDIFIFIDSFSLNIKPNILSDLIRDNLKNNGIGLIGLNFNNQNMIVCSITKDLGQSFSAGDIVKK